MSLTVGLHLALVFRVFIAVAVAIMVMVGGRHEIGP